MGCTSSSAGLAPEFREVVKVCPTSSNTLTTNSSGEAFLDKYNLGSKLGAGAFAQVRCASFKPSFDKDEVPPARAVKILDLRANKDDPDVSSGDVKLEQGRAMEARCEVRVWQKVTAVQNPHLVVLHEVFWDSPCVFMVMERCDMNLLQDLDKARNLDEAYMGGLFQQMLFALHGLHGAGIAHRDIKPDNFFVNRGGHVKLGDYGLAVVMPPKGGVLNGTFGTPPFMSPEMVRKAGYDIKTDIWSFGVVMYVLLYGAFPYVPKVAGAEEMKACIREGKTQIPFTPCRSNMEKPSFHLEKLIRTILQRDPAKRPSAPQVLEHVYWEELQKMLKASERNRQRESSSLKMALQGAKQAGAFALPLAPKGKARKDATDRMLEEVVKAAAAGALVSPTPSRSISHVSTGLSGLKTDGASTRSVASSLRTDSRNSDGSSTTASLDQQTKPPSGDFLEFLRSKAPGHTTHF
mmetsp:Transcript_15636/g.36609  ORF Transcript_15636/g.36609 Transcript_15636/m.36609 type:complete len:464 (+) Transcript_15636:40-1431(+)